MEFFFSTLSKSCTRRTYYSLLITVFQQTWLIYALGGGWGHLHRSLALARVAKTQHQVKIITNCSYFANTSTQDYHIYHIPPELDFQQTSDRLKQILQQTDYDHLIVDTFPRGLGGELTEIIATIDRPKVLVHRYLNPKYIKRYQLHQFVQRNYDLILIPGEHTASSFTHLSQTHRTKPWVIRRSHELANLSTAATLLRLTPAQVQLPLVIILASGYASELAIYGMIAAILHQQGYIVRCLAPTLPPGCPSSIWQFHYPAMECLWLADLAIGGGGYNTVFECSLLNIPLIALPHQRLYDCQKTRIITQQQQSDRCFLAKNPTEVLELVPKLLPTTKSLPFQPSLFTDGVIEAIKKITITT